MYTIFCLNGKLYTQTEIETRLVEMSGKEADDICSYPKRKVSRCLSTACAESCFCDTGIVGLQRPSCRGVNVVTAANVFTIGFTQTSADQFFERLLTNGVSKVVDVRLHNTSQLAGFAKATDLPYLLKKIGNIQFVHQPLLAPTDEMPRKHLKTRRVIGACTKAVSSP